MTLPLELGQTLLLAAFAPRDEALAAWDLWERSSNWQDHVEFDAYLLLPQVYHNLGSGAVEDALFSRLKGIIRQNWVANSHRLALLKAILNCSTLPVRHLIVLPPLSSLSDDRSTAFSNENAAIWLPHRQDLPELIAKLSATGWLIPDRHIPRWSLHGFVAAATSLALQHPKHGALELKWPGGEYASGADWQPLREGVQANFAGCVACCLTAEDTVRYLLLAPGLGSAFRRCARALLYLRQPEHEAGWRQLLQLLQTCSSPLLESVRMLAPQTKAMQEPTAILRRTTTQNSPRLPVFRKQLQHWKRFQNDLGDNTGTAQMLAALPGYLMGKWELNRPSQIPGRLLIGVMSDFRYRLRK